MPWPPNVGTEVVQILVFYTFNLLTAIKTLSKLFSMKKKHNSPIKD
jgi:hypothetical protein